LLNIPELPARILYGWADLYSAQLQGGDGYDQLQPTYSIWLLGQTLRPGVTDAVHRFRLRDDQGGSLVNHGGIWLLEPSKCRIAAVETEQDRWLKFFIEGGRLDAERLPAWMQTEEMRQAMSTLKAFSEKERAYHAYQARQNYLRQQKSMENYLNTRHAEIERMQAEKAQIQAEKERARAAEEQARAEKEQVQAEKEAALAEIERLKALLRN